MTISVFALCPGQRVELAASVDEPVLVPSSLITIEAEGESLPSSAVLDGLNVKLARNASGERVHAVFDFHRSVGFHRFELAGKTFLFGTDDAKLKLDGIQSLLNYIGDTGLSWGHQLFFSDGVSLRHPKVDFAWLSTNGPEIAALARSISAEPRKTLSRVPKRGKPQGRRVVVPATMRLLRSSPSTLLEEHPTGQIAVGDRRFHPRQVITMQSEASLDSVAHRRIARLLWDCVEMAAALMSRVPPAAKAGLLAIGKECRELIHDVPFSHAANQFVPLPEHATKDEHVDARYGRLYELYDELIRKRAWRGDRTLSSRFAYVEYADQIFQAFVALTLAEAMDAPLVVPAMAPGLTRPVFESERFQLYYDTVPPNHFVNWRMKSNRPADMRPDISIVDVQSNTGILVDAKYRVERSGALTPTALNDAQVYLQSFGMKSIAIFYPGTAVAVNKVSADGNTILEVPVRPGPHLAPFLRDIVVPELRALMEPLH